MASPVASQSLYGSVFQAAFKAAYYRSILSF